MLCPYKAKLPLAIDRIWLVYLSASGVDGLDPAPSQPEAPIPKGLSGVRQVGENWRKGIGCRNAACFWLSGMTS